METMAHDVWVEVDLAALKHNLKQVKSLLAEDVKIIAVVKANGYGHGYVQPSRAFLEAGAHGLAVTRFEEALALRGAGILAPVLLLAPIQEENIEAALDCNLDLTVGSLPCAQAINAAAERIGKAARIQVKVDTGMGRLGLPPQDVAAFFKSIRDMPRLQVAGTFTHFATAADRPPKLGRTRRQLQRFQAILEELRGQKIDYGLAHAANSAATIRMPESHLDAVRCGNALYGLYSSLHVPHTLDLKSAWKLKARICEIKELSKGSHVGYGAEYRTRRKTRIAVIPVGYVDGFTLAPEGPFYRQSLFKFAVNKLRRRPYLELHGRKAPVIGRVAMQMTILDVTDLPGAQVGDEVIVPALRIPSNPFIPRVYLDSPQET